MACMGEINDPFGGTQSTMATKVIIPEDLHSDTVHLEQNVLSSRRYSAMRW